MDDIEAFGQLREQPRARTATDAKQRVGGDVPRFDEQPLAPPRRVKRPHWLRNIFLLVLAYFATFCPVCAEHVPELERHFWKKYRDRGVEIVAVDSHDASVEGGMKGVQDYVRRFGNTHPVGLESPATPTYAALVRNYRGANPFPVDVVVGRDGLISYIAREYDPDALEAAIEAALAR